jgi:hypothetical protein
LALFRKTSAAVHIGFVPQKSAISANDEPSSFGNSRPRPSGIGFVSQNDFDWPLCPRLFATVVWQIKFVWQIRITSRWNWLCFAKQPSLRRQPPSSSGKFAPFAAAAAMNRKMDCSVCSKEVPGNLLLIKNIVSLKPSAV